MSQMSVCDNFSNANMSQMSGCDKFQMLVCNHSNVSMSQTSGCDKFQMLACNHSNASMSLLSGYDNSQKLACNHLSQTITISMNLQGGLHSKTESQAYQNQITEIVRTIVHKTVKGYENLKSDRYITGLPLMHQ